MLLGRMSISPGIASSAAEQFLIARDSFPEAIRLRANAWPSSANFEARRRRLRNPLLPHRGQGIPARRGPHVSGTAFRPQGNGSPGGPDGKGLGRRAKRSSAWARSRPRKANRQSGDGRLRLTSSAPAPLLPSGEGWSEAAIAVGVQSAREGKLDQAIRVLSMGLKSAPPVRNRRYWRKPGTAWANAWRRSANGRTPGRICLRRSPWTACPAKPPRKCCAWPRCSMSRKEIDGRLSRRLPPGHRERRGQRLSGAPSGKPRGNTGKRPCITAAWPNRVPRTPRPGKTSATPWP